MVGLIMYLVWQDTKPIKAKGAGKFALWGVGTMVALYLLIFIGGIIAAVTF